MILNQKAQIHNKEIEKDMERHSSKAAICSDFFLCHEILEVIKMFAFELKKTGKIEMHRYYQPDLHQKHHPLQLEAKENMQFVQQRQ